jgi:hypothetical protein
VLIYDGGGNASSLRVGRLGNGISVIGSLSSDSLSAAGLGYPNVDGTANQFLQTNGAGKLNFASLAGSDLPTLSPDPANTYVYVKDLTVDSKGRVTNVTTEVPEPYPTQPSIFTNPLLRLDTVWPGPYPGYHQEDMYCGNWNKPAGTTHVFLAIEMQIVRYNGASTAPSVVYINGVNALMCGSDTFILPQAQSVLTCHTLWIARLNGDYVTVGIQQGTPGVAPIRTRIGVVGYATYNVLSP